MRPSTSCQICRKSCEDNQKINCLKCGARVHLKCANVGLNFGNHNFVCKGCHNRRRSYRELSSTHNVNVSVESVDLPDYHSVADLNQNLEKSNKNNLFVLHFNIVSLVLHKDTIESLLTKIPTKPDIICITESRLNKKNFEWQAGLSALPGYKLSEKFCDHSKTSAGGVAMYINLKIFDKVKVKSELRLDVESCESVFIEIEINKNGSKDTNILIGCIYRHPRWVTTPFIDQLCKKLNMHIEKNIPLVLLGDFNIDILETDENIENTSLRTEGEIL